MECTLAYHPLTSRAQLPTCVSVISPPPLLCRLARSLLPPQLLKKGSTGLIVGNARANICLISGAAALHMLRFVIQRAVNLWFCSLWSSYCRGAIAPCGGKGKTLAAPSLLLFVTGRRCPQCLDYLNANIGKQGAQSSK